MASKKFIVLGGGTSGWITALSVHQLFPEAELTVIYSPEKGIVGVGEATTPHFVDFLKEQRIDLTDFVNAVGATFKNGISFQNWNGDQKSYLHPFRESISEFHIPRLFGHTCWDFYLKTLHQRKLLSEEYTYQGVLTSNHKVDVDNTDFAFHFDANKCAQYLEEVARKRGVKIIQGEYTGVRQNHDGYVTHLMTDHGEHECDFVFDCSGFHRALIGGLYGQKWISYGRHLPMKKAITFWRDVDETFTPKTSAIAMSAGWMWQIPLQDRTGCGYVFDSDYIDPDQATHEAQRYYGEEVEVRKVLSFDAGRYENIWVKNCIAVGLSGNFIEPLESTSIWLQLTLLFMLRHFLNNIDKLDDENIKFFNSLIGNDVDEKMEFVYLHYLTKRNDSDFWREFRSRNPAPDRINRIMPFISSGDLKFHHLELGNLPSYFALRSYLTVAAGLELLESENNFDCYELIEPGPEAYRELIDQRAQACPTHAQILSALRR